MSGYFLGIDMGGTTTKATAVDRQGRVVITQHLEVPTGANLGAAHVIGQMKLAADMSLKAAGIAWKDVLSAVLATPGPAINGVLGKCSNLPHLAGADVRTGLEKALAAAGTPMPVAWVNDANAGTYADWAVFGEPRGLGVIGLYPGTGLGGGYVGPKGDLLEGEHGAGAELGHLPMPFWLMEYEEKWKCGCGRVGCVETAASIAGLRNQLPDALKRPEFAKHKLALSDEPVAKKVLSLRTLAQEGDELALHLFARQAKVLAATLVMAQCSYDASVCVLGGGLTEPAATTPKFRQWFAGLVKSEYEKWAFDPAHPIEVVLTEMGDMAQAVGAAQLARHHYQTHGK